LFKTNDDGSEIFSFDGKALIKFHPLKTSIEDGRIRVDQNYDLFYHDLFYEEAKSYQK